MCLHRFFLIILIIFLPVASGLAGQPDALRKPFKFYIETDMGQQNISANAQSSIVNDVVFMPYDRKDLMERVSFGYFLVPFLGFEVGTTFFSGYAYKLAPLENTVNHSLFSFELLAKGVLNYKSLHIYVMGGPALVYSGVGGFHVSSGQFNAEGSVLEIDAHWPNTYFLRPEARVGISADVTKQILLGVVYAMVFGTGSFQTSISTNDSGQPEMNIHRGYLPTMQYLAATVTFLF